MLPAAGLHQDPDLLQNIPGDGAQGKALHTVRSSVRSSVRAWFNIKYLCICVCSRADRSVLLLEVSQETVYRQTVYRFQWLFSYSYRCTRCTFLIHNAHPLSYHHTQLPLHATSRERSYSGIGYPRSQGQSWEDYQSWTDRTYKCKYILDVSTSCDYYCHSLLLLSLFNSGVKAAGVSISMRWTSLLEHISTLTPSFWGFTALT